MTHNRLLNFHVVRSTKPVTYTPGDFVAPRGIRIPREQSHLTKHPDYPDTLFYLSHSGKYFFRHSDLRHLRIEQVNRYFAFGDGENASEALEDTLGDEDDEVEARSSHRHYDKFAQDMPSGTLMHSRAQGVPGLRRRKPGRLACSRVNFLEPIGARREAFYEQRLLLGLAWYCSEPPFVDDSGAQSWRFSWTPPEETGAPDLEPLELWIGADAISFERISHEIEMKFCASEHNLVCECCAMSLPNVCPNCEFAVGFHWCVNSHLRDVWSAVIWFRISQHINAQPGQGTALGPRRRSNRHRRW